MSEGEAEKQLVIRASSSKAQPAEFPLLSIDFGEEKEVHKDMPLIPEDDETFLRTLNDGTIIPLSIRRDYNILVTAAQVAMIQDYIAKEQAKAVVSDSDQGVDEMSHQRKWIVESCDRKKTIVQKVSEYHQRILSSLPKQGSLRRMLFSLMGKDKGDQK